MCMFRITNFFTLVKKDYIVKRKSYIKQAFLRCFSKYHCQRLDYSLSLQDQKTHIYFISKMAKSFDLLGFFRQKTHSLYLRRPREHVDAAYSCGLITFCLQTTRSLARLVGLQEI